MQIHKFKCKIRQCGNIFDWQFSSQRIGIVLAYMCAVIGCHISICSYEYCLLYVYCVYSILYIFQNKLIASCDILNGNSCRRFLHFKLTFDVLTQTLQQKWISFWMCVRNVTLVLFDNQLFCCYNICNQYNISIIDSFSLLSAVM